ncbi:MAG: translation elongation factor Ts [Acutalibacteraceae bacterium]|nr:translation elongation factor Ts [Acutalibacteraceae bacterium]
MAAFTAKDVQALREKTNVGMMDCKKALVEADGDVEKAIDILREKGLATAAKKAGRIAAEGVIGLYTDGKSSALVELNCETDFVGNNPEFKALANQIAKTVVESKPADLDALLATTISEGSLSVADSIQELFLKIRENLKLRRFALVEGTAVSYIHGGGSVGVLVSFETNAAENDEFVAMGKNIAMQVAAMNPTYLDAASVPAEVVEKEKAINLAQMNEDPKMANKPEQVKEKIIEGKIKKFYTEVCLLDQAFVRSDLFEGSVSGYVANVAKTIGADIKVTGFTRLAKGEGIEKKVDDFAAEVASMM